MNRSLITLSELAQLVSIDATDEEFKTAWNVNGQLSSRFRLDTGYVVEERGDAEVGDPLVRAEEDNRVIARRNIRTAAEFTELSGGSHVCLVAVAGGNSYNSARRGDDIDIFCVTTKDSLWMFMLRSLLLARLRSFGRNSPSFCFSYVVDEGKAHAEFGEPKDGLFARDALSARILKGGDFYRALLVEGSWMKEYFPKLYALRTAGEEARAGRPKRGNQVLNSFLYYTVGSYVRMRASLLNRKYRNHGDASAVFAAKVGRDHCIYESNRYRALRNMYAKIGEGTGS